MGTNCRVCGLAQVEPPWGEDGASPTFAYCDCCGTEFGYQDVIPEAARAARARWLEKGAPWSVPQARPTEWDLKAQLRSVPPEFAWGEELHRFSSRYSVVLCMLDM